MALLALAVGIILSATRHSWLPVLVLAVTTAGVSGLASVFKTVLGFRVRRLHRQQPMPTATAFRPGMPPLPPGRR